MTIEDKIKVRAVRIRCNQTATAMVTGREMMKKMVTKTESR